MIGRHFLVFQEASPRKRRHYTICNTMRPEIYRALLNLGDTTESVEALLTLLDDADSTQMCLTLKNYKKKKGLSTQIHMSESLG